MHGSASGSYIRYYPTWKHSPLKEKNGRGCYNLQNPNCPMFAGRLRKTMSPYRWPVGSLPSTYMFDTPLHCTKDVYTPQGSTCDLWTFVCLWDAVLTARLTLTSLLHLKQPNFVVEWLNSCFVFGRTWVQISAWRPALLIGIVVVFISHCRQMLRQYLKLGHDRFLPHILSSSSFIYHPFMRRSIIWFTDKASLNKIQVRNIKNCNKRKN
jgi:hypothetical protein